MQTVKSFFWPLSLLAGGHVHGGRMREPNRFRRVLLGLGMPLLFVLAGAAWGQPVWEEITPLAGHSTIFVTEHITPESGMWASVCSYGDYCYMWEYRPCFSSDGGTTWELRDNGLPSTLGVLEVAVNPVNPNRLMISTTGTDSANLGPWMSTDQGLSWRAVREVHFAWGPTNDQWLQCAWFADGAHALYVDEIWQAGGLIHVSADSGHTWIDSVAAVEDDGPNIMAHPQIPSIGWVGTSVMRRTTDFGLTWTLGPWGRFSYFVFGDIGPGPERVYANAIYVAGTPGNYYPVCLNIVSEDTGQTWTFLNPLDTILWQEPRQQLFDVLLDPLRPGHLLSLTYDTLFESVDDGQTWIGVIGDTLHWTETMGYDAVRDWLYTASSSGGGRGGIWRWRRELDVGIQAPPRDRSQLLVSLSPNPLSRGETLLLQTSLPCLGPLEMRLYNILGREVVRWSSSVTSGSWPGGIRLSLPPELASGTYIADIQVGHARLRQRLFILR